MIQTICIVYSLKPLIPNSPAKRSMVCGWKLEPILTLNKRGEILSLKPNKFAGRNFVALGAMLTLRGATKK